MEDLEHDLWGKYFGHLYKLISPIQEKYELPVKVGLKNILNYLVVDSSETAIFVDWVLTEKGFYHDILILDKVPEPYDTTKFWSLR